MENLEIFLMDQDHFIPDVFEAYFLWIICYCQLIILSSGISTYPSLLPQNEIFMILFPN
jgi:hypothetical protein